MAFNKLAATIFVLCLLLSSPLSSACGACTASPPPVPSAYCPKNALKLGVCAGILGINVVLGSPPYSQCCALLNGLGELEAALCLCTALKANVLGAQINVPVALELILSQCKRPIPASFICE